MRRSRSRKAMPRKRFADLAIVIAALVLLVALAFLRQSQQARQISIPSTYDTGANGYAALYDLLAREGTRVQRFELPLGELSSKNAALVLAGRDALAGAASSTGTLQFLDRWVHAGGTLVVLDDAVSASARRTLALPQAHQIVRQTRAFAGCAFAGRLRGAQIAGAFTGGYTSACKGDRATLFSAEHTAVGIALKRGRGAVVLLTSPSVFDNLHLAQQSNARAAYALLGGGTVIFDERVHGHAAGRTFWEVLPMPMHVAIWLAIGIVLIAIVGANLPFAPPIAPQAPEERDSGAYIASVAHMLQRGGAAREAILRISGRCTQVLSVRPRDELARMLLRELRTLEAIPRPGAHDVLHAGHIYARVRKEYGC